MKGLSNFIAKQLDSYGANARLARELSVTPATISHWASGKMTPDFASCLKLALYFNISPMHVFEMSGKQDFVRLFKDMVAMIEAFNLRMKIPPEQVSCFRAMEKIFSRYGVNGPVTRTVRTMVEAVAAEIPTD